MNRLSKISVGTNLFFSLFLLTFLLSCVQSSHDNNDLDNDSLTISDESSSKETWQSALYLEIDSEFVFNYNSTDLPHHNEFKDKYAETNQEGYPEIFENLEYFLLDKKKVSENVDLHIVVTSLPNHIEFESLKEYRSVYFVTYQVSNKNTMLDFKQVGKYKNLDDRISTVYSQLDSGHLQIYMTDSWFNTQNEKLNLLQSQDCFIRVDGDIECTSPSTINQE